VVGQTDTESDGTDLRQNNALHQASTYMTGGFLTKLDGSGNVKWTTVESDSIRTNTVTIGKRIAFATGNDIAEGDDLHVLGSTTGDLSSNSNHGVKDIYLAKYHLFPMGTQVGASIVTESTVAQFAWLHQYGSALGATDPVSLHVDAEARVYITGATAAPLAGQPLVGSSACFIMALKPQGNVGPYTDVAQDWIKTLDSGGSTSCTQITGDSSGNLYVTGVTTGLFDAESPCTNSQNYIVAKLDSTGALLWLRPYGVDLKNTVGRSLALDSACSIPRGKSASPGRPREIWKD